MLHESLETENLCYNGRFIERLFEDGVNHNAFDILKAVKEKTGYFDINSIIKSEWHHFNRIIDMNTCMFEAAIRYFEFIKNKQEYSRDDAIKILSKVNQELLFTHKYYCFPVLAEESPFKTDLNKIVNDISIYIDNDMSDDYYLDCLRLLDSYVSLSDMIAGLALSLRIRGTDSSAYESLVKEFISDKYVFVTPAGLNLYLKENSSDDSDFEMSDMWAYSVADESLKVPLGKLSSGESKILALAYFTLTSNRSVLIMDEPELSTSIVWQEMMLPTILEYGNFKSIVIATHSPYIVRDESLKDYIEYLP